MLKRRKKKINVLIGGLNYDSKGKGMLDDQRPKKTEWRWSRP